MNSRRIIIGALVGVMVVVISFLSYRWFESQHKIKLRYLRNPLYNFVYSKACIIRGGIVTDTNTLGGSNLIEPYLVCGFTYKDAKKECFDGNDCEGGCYLKYNRDGSYQGTSGTCQIFKSHKWCDEHPGLSVERRDGKIINHSCPIS